MLIFSCKYLKEKAYLLTKKRVSSSLGAWDISVPRFFRILEHVRNGNVKIRNDDGSLVHKIYEVWGMISVGHSIILKNKGIHLKTSDIKYTTANLNSSKIFKLYRFQNILYSQTLT